MEYMEDTTRSCLNAIAETEQQLGYTHRETLHKRIINDD
jgi:hypothetical protein